MVSLAVDIIFGVLVFAAGLYYLLKPFEKLKEKYPKMKSEKVVKVCAVLLMVVGAITVVVGILGLI